MSAASLNLHGVDNIEVAFETSVGVTLRIHSVNGMHMDLDLYPAETHGYTEREPGAAVIVAMLKDAIEEWESKPNE